MLSRKVGPLLLLALLGGCTSSIQTPLAVDKGSPLSPCMSAGTSPAAGIVIGFGQGATVPEARQRAYADISEQLSVQITSDSEASVSKRNAELDSTFQQTLTSHSEAQLSELRLECLDQHSTPGRVYLSYSYDQRARAMKLADRLSEVLGYQPARVFWDGPTALTQSPMLLRINKELARRQGAGLPTLPMQLFWRSAERQWSLQLGNLPVSLSPAELQLAVAWQHIQQGEAALAVVSIDGGLQSGHIRAESEYRLALKHPKGGYGQLLGIYENGSIDVVRSNIALKPNEASIVPEAGGVFEAALLEGQGTTDTWLLLVTDARLTARDLPSLYQGSDAAQLQSLLEQLEELEADIAVKQLAVE